MSWQTLSWRLPISELPRIAFMGFGIHGPGYQEHYRLDRFWCIHLYPYKAEVIIDGVWTPIQPGFVSVVPPGVEMIYTFPSRCQHACAHFDYRGEGIATHEIPAMQDFGARFGSIFESFEEGIAAASTNIARAQVRLWDILWRVAERHTPGFPPANRWHPALVRALAIIELRLAEPLRVQEIAREVDLSHNQLTRLFRAARGTTVIGYIQERRLARAKHLLLNTHLPVRAIAMQVGVPNAHQFNKMMHRLAGCSPREAREKGFAAQPSRETESPASEQ